MTSASPRIRILLVDDDEDFLFQHRLLLENSGFEVKTALNRAEAEAEARGFQPDLAIIDLMMEQHDDGFILAHHLRKNQPGLPVILVTAVSAETGLNFAPASPSERRWVGADAVLAKPIRFEQLKREIDRLLAERPQA
jgi:two-component system, OmpR family, response regulator